MFGIDLTGKNAVVVGGSRGIGAACVRALAQAGASVGIVYPSFPKEQEAGQALAQELKAQGTKVALGEADATKRDQVDAAFSLFERELGPVHIVIYSAGTTSRRAFVDITDEDWAQIMGVNLNGAFYVLQRAVPGMEKAGDGRIVLIGSQVTITGGGGGAHYVASKSALEGLTRHLTRELLPKNIRINSVLPSLIETDLLKERYPDDAERAAVAKQVPRGRLGQPEDIANVALFLVSDLSDYICGQHLLVDGGRTFTR
jgi:3-oxoacyl-[acyl-carrier protein] reductase